MKYFLLPGLCLFMSLSAIGGIIFTDVSFQQSSSTKNIEEEMDKLFAIRDTFKEKGNSGKYLKFSNLQP